jgi:hypothetical protein
VYVATISELLVELATELDAHYEDDEFFALGVTIEKMKNSITLITADNPEFKIPDVVKHVLARYNRNNN